MRKLLLIGLDGATWKIIKPWVDRGQLKMFKKLMSEGVWGELESSMPPFTIPGWECISTGKTPETLGIYSFMMNQGYKFFPYTTRVDKRFWIWNILSNAGLKVIVANNPSLFEVGPVNGVLVCGFLYKDKNNFAYPPEVMTELKGMGYMVDTSDVNLDVMRRIGHLSHKAYVEKVNVMLEKRIAVYKHLLREKEWDFSFLVLTSTDRLQHKTKDERILLQLYKKIDDGLEEFISLAGKDTNLIMVSDHGFGDMNFQFFTNEWLIREGYLKIRHGYGASPVRRIRDFAVKKVYPLYIIIRKISLIFPRLENVLTKKTQIKEFEDIDIDWSQTKAFAYGAWGSIYLNVKGRQPEGIVEKEEYDKIVDEIICKLRNLSLAGRQLPVKVFKKR